MQECVKINELTNCPKGRLIILLQRQKIKVKDCVDLTEVSKNLERGLNDWFFYFKEKYLIEIDDLIELVYCP